MLVAIAANDVIVRFTTVTGCSAREVGLYEKQSSFFIQAKTALSRVQGNVFFNGPRAGINANDGCVFEILLDVVRLMLKRVHRTDVRSASVFK